MSTVTAVLAGILLGYLALLMFFLGLFFFLLFGLLPSAVLFRYGDPIRPIPRLPLFIGGLLLLGGMWLVADYVEYRLLPTHVAVKVRGTIVGFPEGYRREILNARVAEMTWDYLRKRYGSAGLIGYAKWAATSGKIQIPAGTIHLPSADKNGSEITLELPKAAVHTLQQPGLLWCIRIGVSFVLVTMAVVLQLAPLAKPAPPPDDDRADEPAQPGGEARA